METIFEIDTFNPPLARQFSLAISRDESGNGNGGVFTIGGIPDLTDPAINASSTYTSAPFQVFPSISSNVYSFYSILVDGIVIGSNTYDQGVQVIIDSGANALDLPQDAADFINSNWSPPPDSNGALPCDAVLTVPVGITIGGATYYIDSQDLIGQFEGGVCASLVEAGSDNEYILGDPLLRNTLAVYDWDNQVMS